MLIFVYYEYFSEFECFLHEKWMFYFFCILMNNQSFAFFFLIFRFLVLKFFLFQINNCHSYFLWIYYLYFAFSPLAFLLLLRFPFCFIAYCSSKIFVFLRVLYSRIPSTPQERISPIPTVSIKYQYVPSAPYTICNTFGTISALAAIGNTGPA